MKILILKTQRPSIKEMYANATHILRNSLRILESCELTNAEDSLMISRIHVGHDMLRDVTAFHFPLEYGILRQKHHYHIDFKTGVKAYNGHCGDLDGRMFLRFISSLADVANSIALILKPHADRFIDIINSIETVAAVPNKFRASFDIEPREAHIKWLRLYQKAVRTLELIDTLNPMIHDIVKQTLEESFGAQIAVSDIPDTADLGEWLRNFEINHLSNSTSVNNVSVLKEIVNNDLSTSKQHTSETPTTIKSEEDPK